MTRNWGLVFRLKTGFSGKVAKVVLAALLAAAAVSGCGGRAPGSASDKGCVSEIPGESAALATDVAVVAGMSSQVSDSPRHVPVLLYHALAPETDGRRRADGMVVPVNEFRSQMYWLKEQGFVTPTLDRFREWLAGNGELPPKSVLITFDDGYRSFATYAHPILKECGFTAVMFIIGARPDSPTAGTRHLSWDDIVAMDETGTVDFQSHTYDGHRGTAEFPDILTWSAERFSDDLAKLGGSFEKHGLKRPCAFAYPFSAASEFMPEILAKHGYLIAFNTKRGHVTQGNEPFSLKRLTIWPGTSLEQFERIVAGPEG